MINDVVPHNAGRTPSLAPTGLVSCNARDWSPNSTLYPNPMRIASLLVLKIYATCEPGVILTHGTDGLQDDMRVCCTLCRIIPLVSAREASTSSVSIVGDAELASRLVYCDRLRGRIYINRKFSLRRRVSMSFKYTLLEARLAEDMPRLCT